MFLNRPLVAVDIGSSSVKVVEISGGTDKKLRAIGLELLPEGIVVDGAIQDLKATEKILKGLIRKLKITTTGRRAAVALSGSSVLIKRVGFTPTDDVSEMHEQIFYEAEQHFQHDMDELYFDYYELSSTPDHNGTIPILLVGAKKEIVEQYLTVIRGLGMRTGLIDCDVFSVSNMFEYNYGIIDGLIAVVNIGATVTQVSLVHRGEYLYTRDISMGGDDYTNRLINALEVDRKNAESLKISASQGDDSVPPTLHEVVSEVNQQLVSEIQVTVDYYFQNGEAPPGVNQLTGVYLAGGGSRTLGLDAAVAASLHVPVQIVNPFHRVNVNPRRFQMDYILAQGHLYSVAVGLAMRTINDSTVSASA
ncbi:MAG: type IV pilus assembly protein PilM [Bdellovibrionota bacterium]